MEEAFYNQFNSSVKTNSIASKLLRSGVHILATELRPLVAVDQLLKMCVKTCTATAGRICLLNTLTGHFDSVADLDWPNKSAIEPNISALQSSPSDPHPLIRALRDIEPRFMPADLQLNSSDRRVVFPIPRLKMSIGFLELSLDRHSPFEEIMIGVNDLVKIFSVYYNRMYATRVFTELRQPIDFSSSRATFLENLGQLITSASSISVWNYYHQRDIGSFAALIKAKAEDNMIYDEELTGDEFKMLNQLAIIDTVESKVILHNTDDYRNIIRIGFSEKNAQTFILVPSIVGNRFRGIIIFALRFRYRFTELEQRALECLANCVGVALANYENYHASLSEVADRASIASAVTGIEVAQAVRHEALQRIGNCQEKMAFFLVRPEMRLRQVEAEINELSGELKAASAALDKIKAATKPPIKDLKDFMLRDIWDKALAMVRGRLADLSVDVRYDGPDMQIRGYPDWFLQILLNLLLNSVDAFAEKKKRRGNEIRLAVELSRERSSRNSIRYRDNATGIDPSRLNIPLQYTEMPWQQAMYQPDVTSKNGGGWGLYLVRKILEDHKGSIDLIDHRNGVVFEITLPTT